MAKKLIKDANGNNYCDPITGKPIVVDVSNDSDTIIEYLGGQYSGKVVDTFGNITALSALAFYGQKIAEVSFPNVSVIGKSYGFTYDTHNQHSYSGATFMECARLKKISLPACESFIFVKNFFNCVELESANFPNYKSTTIAASTFYNCIKLSTVEFPTVTKVEESAFYNCTNLKTFNVEDGLSSVGRYAFCNCQSLESIKFASSSVSLGGQAFQSCGLKNLSIDCDTLSAVAQTFAYCSQLENVYIKVQNSISTIGNHCFEHCQSLQSATLVQETGTLSLSQALFSYCTSLENVTLSAPEGIQLTSYIFENCWKLKWGNLSNAAITRINGYGVFARCSSLEYAYLPMVSSIYCNYMFSNCSNLSYIYMPMVSYMGPSTLFYYCNNLQALYIMQKSGLTEENIPTLTNSGMFSTQFSVGISTSDGHPWIYVGYPEYVHWLQNATNWATYASWIIASQFVPPTE